MKLLKTLILMSIVNTVALVLIVTYGTRQAPEQLSKIELEAGQFESQLDTQPLGVGEGAPATVPTIAPATAATPTTAPTTTPTTPPPPTTAPTPAPTAPPPTPTAPPTPAPTPSNQCVIVVDGAQYNITTFRKQHSGGDIFQCGTDMSSIFWSEHGQKQLQQMQKYRI